MKTGIKQIRLSSHKPIHIIPLNCFAGQFSGRNWKADTLRKAIVIADEHSGVALPNIALPARKTLLAEIIRSPLPDNQLNELCDLCAGKAALNRYVRRWRMNLRQSPAPSRVDPKKIDSLKGRLLGVEIEYYPSPGQSYGSNRLNTPLCNAVYDGSLSSGGEEIRKLTWQSRDGRLAGLTGLRIYGRVNKDCGLHVHVDVRHLTRQEAEACYDRVVESFYPFLKKICPKSRQRNRYCNWVSNRSGSPDYAPPSNGERYAALNWCSYEEHGTLEFRMQGCFNPASGRVKGQLNMVAIESWALLCQEIVRWASDPNRVNPSSWETFVSGLPEPLSSWARLRKESLYGSLAEIRFDERTSTAIG